MNDLFETLAEATKPDAPVENLSDYKYTYPELSENGKKVTEDIIRRFSEQLLGILSKTIGEFTCNIGNEITVDDSWINVREKVRDALMGYPVEGEYQGYEWKNIRAKILEENREQIMNDILKDKEKEIEALKESIRYLQNRH